MPEVINKLLDVPSYDVTDDNDNENNIGIKNNAKYF